MTEGERKEEWLLLNWPEGGGKEKKEMAFTEAKYQKRGVIEGEKGGVCGERKAARMGLGLWVKSKHSNHKCTLNRVKTTQSLSNIQKHFQFLNVTCLMPVYY